MHRWFQCLGLFLALLVCAAPVRGEDRLALLVGNDAYGAAEGRLHNAGNDAVALGETLKGLGFEVVVVKDADRRTMDAAVDRFARRLGAGAMGLFFYAGHGIQVDGENYLLPTDFKAGSEEEVRYGGIPASLIHERMQKSGSRLNIMVLDACRDNPFRMGRGGSKGLAAMNAGKGSFLAFATAPGQTASDNAQGSNGLFTSCLLEVLRQPDLDLEDVFNRTREQVVLRSRERQVPWTSSSVVGRFVFWDLAVQERRLGEEKARLEAELAQLQRDQAEARRRLGATEALRREQDLKERIRQQAFEQARLAQAAQQDRQRQVEALAGAEAERARALGREQARLAQERNLETIRRQLAKESAGQEPLTALDLSAARKQKAALEARIQGTSARFLAEKDRALAQIDADFGAIHGKYAAPSAPKSEFETAQAYAGRLAVHDRRLADLDAQIAEERRKVEARFGMALQEQNRPDLEQIERVKAGLYPLTGLKVVLGPYDPDREEFGFNLIQGEDLVSVGIFEVPPARARQLKEQVGGLAIQALGPFVDGPARIQTLAISDPVLGLLKIRTDLSEEQRNRIAAKLRPTLRLNKRTGLFGMTLRWMRTDSWAAFSLDHTQVYEFKRQDEVEPFSIQVDPGEHLLEVNSAVSTFQERNGQGYGSAKVRCRLGCDYLVSMTHSTSNLLAPRNVPVDLVFQFTIQEIRREN